MMTSQRKRKLEMDENDTDAKQGKPALAEPPLPSVNPYNSRPYSQRFHNILDKRKGTFSDLIMKLR
jgi:hypothetical protein